MTKRNIAGVLLLLASGIPYAFVAMFADFACGNAAFYVVLFAVSVLFGWLGGKIDSVPMVIAGNGLSGILSFVCLLYFRAMNIGDWNAYFKPFGAAGTCALLLVASYIVHLLICRHYRKDKLVSYLLYAALAALAMLLAGGFQLLSAFLFM